MYVTFCRKFNTLFSSERLFQTAAASGANYVTLVEDILTVFVTKCRPKINSFWQCMILDPLRTLLYFPKTDRPHLLRRLT